MAYISYYHFMICHLSIPYSNPINLQMVGIFVSSMHPTSLEILKEIIIIGLIPEVTAICNQVNFINHIILI